MDEVVKGQVRRYSRYTPQLKLTADVAPYLPHVLMVPALLFLFLRSCRDAITFGIFNPFLHAEIPNHNYDDRYCTIENFFDLDE